MFASLLVALALAGCASKPTGPKLFDSANLVVKADGAITVPPDLSKDFVETIRSRTVLIAKSELAKQGDMTQADSCGPRVMKVVQDISAISMSQNLSASRGLFGGVTQDTKQEVNISTSLRLEDCQTGKLLYSYDYAVTGNNPAQILQTLVEYNIYLAYRSQYQR
jgi:hypothetical protein